MASWLTTRNSNLASFNAVAINYSTLTGSTITDNTMTVNRVNYSTLIGSSIATTSISTTNISTTSISTNSFALASTLTGSSIILSGNVGIGTNTPTTLLQVNGIITGTQLKLAQSATNNVVVGSANYVGGGNTNNDYSVVIGNGGTGGGVSGTGTGAFQNVIIGGGAAIKITTADSNTIVGNATVQANTFTGTSNSCFGYASGYSLSSGTYNTCIGTGSGFQLTTGSNNVCIGASSGFNGIAAAITTGSQNVYIGSNSLGSASGNTNEIAIGYNTQGAGSNTITFGNGNNTKTIFTAGNVGIGTTTPQATLHVHGNTLITNPSVSSALNIAGWYIIGYWDCSAYGSSGSHIKIRVLGCNGFDSPSVNGQRSGGETIIYMTNLNNANAGAVNIDGWWKHEGGLLPFTSIKIVQNGTNRNQYYVYAYVQTYTQHVINAETSGGTIWTTSFTSTTDPGVNSSTVQLLQFSYAVVGSNVGIGTTSPTANFQVWGSSQFSNVLSISANNVIIGATAPNQSLEYRFQAISYYYTLDNATYFRLFNYGAGTATTKVRIDWPLAISSTDISYSPGASGWVFTSDIRLKTNITPLSSCLTNILALQPVSYQWIVRHNPDQVCYGFIAQHTQQILPEIIEEHDKLAPDGTPYLSLQSNMNAFIVKAIQEQHAIIEQQSTQIVSLQSQITSLRSELSTATTITTLQSQLADILQRLTNANL